MFRICSAFGPAVGMLGCVLLGLGCASNESRRLDAGTDAGSGGRSQPVAHGGASGAGGGHSHQGGAGGAGDAAGHAGQSAADRCSDSALTWRTGNKTNYTSYPEPGSQECIELSGCKYQGMFAACEETKSEDWVSKHNIVAIYPDLRRYELHDLCLRKPDGSKSIVVTVYDTCSDDDCDGCCTQNRGSAGALIDVEHYTDERWGVGDGPIMWADLGPTASDGCRGE